MAILHQGPHKGGQSAARPQSTFAWRATRPTQERVQHAVPVPLQECRNGGRLQLGGPSPWLLLDGPPHRLRSRPLLGRGSVPQQAVPCHHLPDEGAGLSTTGEAGPSQGLLLLLLPLVPLPVTLVLRVASQQAFSLLVDSPWSHTLLPTNLTCQKVSCQAVLRLPILGLGAWQNEAGQLRVPLEGLGQRRRAHLLPAGPPRVPRLVPGRHCRAVVVGDQLGGCRDAGCGHQLGDELGALLLQRH